MHLIILPGNSKEYNEKWLEDSKEHFEDLFETTTTHYYEHWKTGDPSINVETEVEKLPDDTEGKEPLIVYAKSAGTTTTIHAVAEGKITPQKCIFVSCPFKSADSNKDFDEALKKFSIPTLFIQQTNDPFFKYEELEKFLEGYDHIDYMLVEIEGDDHSYENYDDIKEMIKDFVS